MGEHDNYRISKYIFRKGVLSSFTWFRGEGSTQAERKRGKINGEKLSEEVEREKAGLEIGNVTAKRLETVRVILASI
jgi:hypothetical protein